MFWRFIHPPPSPSRWRQLGPLKRWYPTTTLYDVTTQKTSTSRAHSFLFIELMPVSVEKLLYTLSLNFILKNWPWETTFQKLLRFVMLTSHFHMMHTYLCHSSSFQFLLLFYVLQINYCCWEILFSYVHKVLLLSYNRHLRTVPLILTDVGMCNYF